MIETPKRRKDDMLNGWYKHKLLTIMIVLIFSGFGYTYLATTALRAELVQQYQQINAKLDCLMNKAMCRGGGSRDR